MYLTVKQQVNQFSKEDYLNVRYLAHIAKNLANQAIFNVRQYYFENGKYLKYEENYKLLKDSPNYKILNSNMAQQVIKEVDGMFKSFFGLLKLAKEGKYKYSDIKLPNYLEKDGFTTLVIGFVRLKGNILVLPYSNQYKKDHKVVEIKIPPILLDKKIKEIRIIPKAKAKFFEIQYVYEANEEQRKLNNNKALAIDLGVNNLATCITNTGESFIIDGKRLKSINQWYNKRNAYLQCIKDKQRFGEHKTTNQQKKITRDKNNKTNDYMAKSARIIINYCLDNDIGVLVVGYNKTLTKESNLGKQTNQNLVNIPLGKLRDKLEYLCKLYGIRFVEQEESYTSKSSFFDKDILPVFNEKNKDGYKFSGKRVKRGLYQNKDGKMMNSDVNGALNILRKSSVVGLEALYSRGELDTPMRIRVL